LRLGVLPEGQSVWYDNKRREITKFNPGTDTFGLRFGWGAFIPAK